MSNSHIQRTIISTLKNADTLRYSQLLPANTDRDLFNYHLRQLVDTGMVEKLPDKQGYRLSLKGQRRVADALHTSDQADRLFKVNVLLIVTKQQDSMLYILNQHRTAQPDYGIWGVPGGTIVKAEPLLEGASRKLLQETGLTATFEYIATTRRIVYKNNILFADVLFPLCLATTSSGNIVDTEFGHNAWVSIDQAITNEGQRIELLPKVLAALKADSLETVRGVYHEQISHVG